MIKTLKIQGINIIVILTGLLFFIFSGGCGKKDKIDPDQEVDLTTIIKSTTGDYLLWNEPIVIELQENVLISGKINKKVTELDFDFEPKIRGKAIWQDKNTLQFEPSSPLRLDELYCCTILPAGRELGDSLVTGVGFSFLVIGQKVNSIERKFEFDKQDDTKFRITGTVSLAAKVEFKKLISAVYINYMNKKHKLQWKKKENNSYSFSSDFMEFSSLEKLEFVMEAKPLRLPYEVRRVYDISTNPNLQLVQASMINLAENPYIEVEFSEYLTLDQDLYTLVDVRPKADISIDATNKIMRITGSYQYETEYTLTIDKKIKSVLFKSMEKDFNTVLNLQDQFPRIDFIDSGAILTSSNKNTIYFESINVQRVHYEITLIYANNICQFFQDNDLGNIALSWYSSPLDRVGRQVAEGVFDIGKEKNIRLQNAIDISRLLPKNKYGIYDIKLRMDRDDVLYKKSQFASYNNDYSSDPTQSYYYYSNGTKKKTLILTDLSITCKYGSGNGLVLVTDIKTGQPIKSAMVKVINYQNQLLAEGYTDKDGFFQFDSSDDPFLVTAEQGSQQSLLKLNGNAWETSSFDVGGVSSGFEKLRAYIYSERGVYRPGDEINISVIMRNDKGIFPQDHPLIFKLYDPNQNMVFEKVQKQSQDGFYHLPFKTSLDDPTGSWFLNVAAGESSFTHELKIETIAPERLKLNYHTEFNKLTAKHDSLKIELQANYLFGNPAAGLRARFEYFNSGFEKDFFQRKWANFTFYDAMRKLTRTETKNIETKTDDNGRCSFVWQKPCDDFNSMGFLVVRGEVIEQGGRATKQNLELVWEPWEAYVGIQNYGEKNGKKQAKVILLDPEGNPVSGENLQVSVYENENYWWMEFDSYSNFQSHFKQLKSTNLLLEKTIISGSEPYMLEFAAIKSNILLIEVRHVPKQGNGHVSSQILNGNRFYGAIGEEEHVLKLNLDKESYEPGETAHLTFPAKGLAKTLVTLEKADELIDWWWYELPANREEADITIAVTKAMVPGLYATISVIQPQADKSNDCPLRMYGIIPLVVVDNNTKQKLELIVPEIIEPGSKFSCQLQAEPGNNTQFTVAVVDEGLLSLTNFPSPDAWKYFYRKQRLDVNSYDNFNQVIQVMKGVINHQFSVGGGIESLFASGDKRQLENTDIKRFEPVSLFSGIIKADANGKAAVEFVMPDYLGTVRIMALSVCGDKYGSIYKNALVRKDLMVNPTLPRALAPGDKIEIPVEVFCFNDKIKQAVVNLSAEGPLEFDSFSENVQLDGRGEALVIFKAEVKNVLQPISVKAEVRSGKYEYSTVTNIPVRPLQPYQMINEKLILQPGMKGKMHISEDALEGTAKSSLVFSRPGFFQYNRHFKYLVRYPYGCLEQTTSALFPQLFIKDILDPAITKQMVGDIDYNITQGLEGLAKFQVSSGGFTYWRGNLQIDMWTSIYVTHFLLEARDKGYYAPGSMLESAINYLENNGISKVRTIDFGLRKIQIYQLYVLAKAGNPALNRMNYVLQNEFNELDNTDRWLLAGAYDHAGQKDIAENIIKDASGTVNTKNADFLHNYGSVERDQSVILAIATQLKHDDIAADLYDVLARRMNDEGYLSTQSRAFILWALSVYSQEHPELFSTEPVIGYATDNSGIRHAFSIEDNNWQLILHSCENIEIALDNNSAPAEFTLYYDRIPNEPVDQLTNPNFSLSRKLISADNEPVKLSLLKQGKIYDLIITIKRLNKIDLENMALSQILPSGWEIVNMRLEGDKDYLGRADYLDIRDDRILWFFDYNGLQNQNTLEFKVKIRAVTAGSFDLPPTSLEAMYLPDYNATLATEKTVISR